MHYSRLENTVTKGIVSAHRKNLKIDGLKLDFIQADVYIHGGNSGGPLLNQEGNIIGISTLGLYADDSKRGAGLNMFVPIGEALQVLDINLNNQ